MAKLRLVWGFVGGLSTLAVGAVVAFYGIESFRQGTCESDLVASRESFAERFCDHEFRSVALEDAVKFLDTYLGRASGAEPTRAWPMLSDFEMARTTLERFESEWTDILWAERLGDVRSAKEFNQFVVSYRTFGGSTNEVERGGVNYYDQKVEIRLTSSGLRMQSREPANRNESGSQQYPWAVVAVDSRTHILPDRQAQSQWPNVSAGGWLRVLCQTHTHDGDWWSRTPLGWISHADLTVENEPIVGALDCDPHHAARSQDLTEHGG